MIKSGDSGTTERSHVTLVHKNGSEIHHWQERMMALNTWYMSEFTLNYELTTQNIASIRLKLKKSWVNLFGEDHFKVAGQSLKSYNQVFHFTCPQYGGWVPESPEYMECFIDEPQTQGYRIIKKPKKSKKNAPKGKNHP